MLCVKAPWIWRLRLGIKYTKKHLLMYETSEAINLWSTPTRMPQLVKLSTEWSMPVHDLPKITFLLCHLSQREKSILKVKTLLLQLSIEQVQEI